MSINETDETRDDIESQIKETEQELDKMAEDMGITVDDKLIIAEEAEKLMRDHIAISVDSNLDTIKDQKGAILC